MPTTEERYIDRTDWPRGEWDDEPDKIQWRDEATGLPCLIVRAGSVGHLCGYVGVSAVHPFHGVDYSACSQQPACAEEWCGHRPASAVDVHGGLTYSAACAGNICHKVDPGEDDAVWWLGFDCAHLGDGDGPGSLALNRKHGFNFGRREGWYRGVAYVRAECVKLAAQLAGI